MQAAQAAHAAFQFAVEHPEITSQWYSGSNYLILLSVPDEWSLLEWVATAAHEDVDFSLVHEPDIDDEATALALAPSSLGAMLSQLPLMGKEVVAV